MKTGDWFRYGFDRRSLRHSVRTAIATMVSLLVARIFRLPEAYWAGAFLAAGRNSVAASSSRVSEGRLLFSLEQQ